MSIYSAATVGNAVITVPVDTEVQEAIQHWQYANRRSLDKALAEFGLDTTDIVQPTYERVVTNREIAQIAESWTK